MSKKNMVNSIMNSIILKTGSDRVETCNYFGGPRNYYYRFRKKGGVSRPLRVSKILGGINNNDLSRCVSNGLQSFEGQMPSLFSCFGWNGKVGRDKKAIVHDFTKIRQLMITGGSGYGKTRATMMLIISMIYGNNPDVLAIQILDIKKEEMSKLSKLVDYKCELDEIKLSLKAAKILVKERQEILHKSGCSSAHIYNRDAMKKGKPFMKYFILLIEEYGVLFEELDKEYQAIVKFLSRIARSVGVYLILSTQRADKDALDTSIKSNMAGRYAFKQQDDVNARIAGIPQSDQLREVGEALLLVDARFDYVKVPNISEELIEFVTGNMEKSSVDFSKLN